MKALLDMALIMVPEPNAIGKARSMVIPTNNRYCFLNYYGPDDKPMAYVWGVIRSRAFLFLGTPRLIVP